VALTAETVTFLQKFIQIVVREYYNDNSDDGIMVSKDCQDTTQVRSEGSEIYTG